MAFLSFASSREELQSSVGPEFRNLDSFAHEGAMTQRIEDMLVIVVGQGVLAADRGVKHAFYASSGCLWPTHSTPCVDGQTCRYHFWALEPVRYTFKKCSWICAGIQRSQKRFWKSLIPSESKKTGCHTETPSIKNHRRTYLSRNPNSAPKQDAIIFIVSRERFTS